MYVCNVFYDVFREWPKYHILLVENTRNNIDCANGTHTFLRDNAIKKSHAFPQDNIWVQQPSSSKYSLSDSTVSIQVS